MIHSTRHQLLTKDVKVLKIRLKHNEDKWLTVTFISEVSSKRHYYDDDNDDLLY